MLHNLSAETNDIEIKKLETKIHKIFDIKTVRGHLEHIEERCIGYVSRGDKKRGKKTNINDFGNFIGDDFSFHGKKFPSSKKCLEIIKGVYKDLIKILNKKCSQNPRFVKRAEMDKTHRKITIALKRLNL